MANDPSPEEILEQYKVLVEDSARFSDRRQTTNNYYLTANSILLGGIGIFLLQTGLGGLLGIAITVIVAAAGFSICAAWRQVILNYRDLLNLRFNMLRHLEGLDGFRGPVNTYQLESYVVYGDAPPKIASQHVREFAITAESMEAAAKLDRDKTAQRAAAAKSGRQRTTARQRVFDFSLREAHIPRIFQIIYVLAALVPVVATVYHNNRAAIAQFAAMFGITLPQ